MSLVQVGPPSPINTKPEAPTLAAPPGQSLLVFHLGPQDYALPLSDVQEVVPMAWLSRPPGLPSILEGFLRIGGEAVPVLRLDRLFHLPVIRAGRYTPLIVLRDADHRLALLVERVSRVVTVAADEWTPLRGNQSFNDCADGLVARDGHVLVLLSAERLLTEKEQQILAEFHDQENFRLQAMENPAP